MQIRVNDAVSVWLSLVLIFLFFLYVRGGSEQTRTGNNHKLCASLELALREGCARLAIFAQQVREYVLTGLAELFPIVEHFYTFFMEGYCSLVLRDEMCQVTWVKVRQPK